MDLTAAILYIGLLAQFRIGSLQQLAFEPEFCLSRPPDCDSYCQYGYRRLPGNRCICACYDPCQGKVCNTNEVCIVQRSEAILTGACRSAINQCPYGVRVNACFISPCLLAECSVDRSLICIPDYCGRCAAHFFERSSGRDVTLLRCYRKPAASDPMNKPGSCPLLTSGLCLNECNTDVECEGPKKCCSNGCGRHCVSGVKAKPGICPPTLSPPSTGICQSNCQSDDDCDGVKKCCFNGCASVCSESVHETTLNKAAAGSLSTTCTELRAAIDALPSRSVLDGFLPTCESDGRFRRVQCDRRVCWCVDSQGQEIVGTKQPSNRTPDCENPLKCQLVSFCNSDSCPFGFKTDETGCPLPTCECINYCQGIRCSNSFQTCRLMHSDCQRQDAKPCLPLPQCAANPCPGGQPQMDTSTGVTLTCSQAATDRCDANHWCHMVGLGGGGVCCPLPSTAVRSGKCPLAKPNSNGRCVMECTSDADCSLNQKCCYNGCGLSCTIVFPSAANADVIPPVLNVSPEIKPGQCPLSTENSGSLFGHCSIQCKVDADCRGDEKCCKFGCNYRCAGPVKGQPVIGSVNSLTSPRPLVLTTPAILPQPFGPIKAGECPQPSRSAIDQCSSGCQTDSDCPSVKKCCSTGCGTRCMYPSKAPLCIHLSAAMEALATSNPAVIIPKCQASGKFERVQCSTNDERSCWCVDEVEGKIEAGTKVTAGTPDCQRPRQCPKVPCSLKCRTGFKMDGDGCFLCRCQDLCENIRCSRPSEICVMMPVQCQDLQNCGAVPRCVVNSCPSGRPAKDLETGQFLQCDSSNPCRSGFWCHNIGLQGSGVCCPFPVRQVHFGHCPAHSLVQLGSGGACFSECLADDDCSDAEKCCFNGCGLSCVTASSVIPGATFTSATVINLLSNPSTLRLSPAATPASSVMNSTANAVAAGSDTVQRGRNQPAADEQKIGVCPRYNSVSRDSCVNDVADCSGDEHCQGSKKCCNDGCIKRCMYPEITTACLHAKAAYEQLHQGANAAISYFTPQCRDNGEYERRQCDFGRGICWCVDENGFEVEGTRVRHDQTVTAPTNCETQRTCSPLAHCSINCLLGFEFNDQGCPICRCRNPCSNITCPEKDHICILARVECNGRGACLPVPRCIANACPRAIPVLNVTSLSEISCRNSNECGQDRSSFCRLLNENTGYCCPSPEPAYRPGHCPNIHLSSPGSCRVECHQDSDCPVNKKCCYNGCGLSCLASSESQVGQDGQCPAASSPFGHCVVECQADSDCRPDYKCCVNGCSRTCILPLEGKGQAPRRAPAGDAKIGICPNQNQTSQCLPRTPPDCSSDKDCVGSRKCCFDGCNNYCTYPKVTTGCLHQQAALEILASRNNTPNPTSISFILKCRPDGSFERVQCQNATGYCWCLDGEGMEIPGTRIHQSAGEPPCDHPRTCPRLQCSLHCPFGYRLVENGCETCACHDPCEDVQCPYGQVCRLVSVECIGLPCLPVPRCLRNPCLVGEPLKNDQTWENQLCDSKTNTNCPVDFFCQASSSESDKGVCCPTIADAGVLQTSYQTTSTFALSLQSRNTVQITSSSNPILSTVIGAISKIGICPQNPLSNPGCATECRTDNDCPSIKKCCIFGCGWKCQLPEATTACLHWKSAMENLATNDSTNFIPKCNNLDGEFEKVQCDSKNKQCWCVDSKTGAEFADTSVLAENGIPECTESKSCNVSCNQQQCQYGFKLDRHGCPLDGRCQCRDPCQNISCPTFGDRCITEKRTCIDSSLPCPPVPTCKPNPCIGSQPIRDVTSGQFLLCSGKFNRECGSDVCVLIAGQSFGFCCPKATSPIFTTASDGIPDRRNELPLPPDFRHWHQMNFVIDETNIPDSERFRRAFIDQVWKVFGLPREDVRDFKVSNNIVTILVNNTAAAANISTNKFNIVLNGSVYTTKLESVSQSKTNQQQLSPATAVSSEESLDSTAFIGLVASTTIFGVVVTIIAIVVCCVLRRRRKARKMPHLVSATSAPYSAALYTTHSYSSEIGRPILETSTDIYTRSLPRKKYFNDDQVGRPSGTWHTSPKLHRTSKIHRSDNQLFY